MLRSSKCSGRIFVRLLLPIYRYIFVRLNYVFLPTIIYRRWISSISEFVNKILSFKREIFRPSKCSCRIFVRLLLSPVYRYFFPERDKLLLPVIKQPAIIYQSATSLASKIRNKQLTSEETVAAYIERIRDVNPILNAVVDDRFAAALEEAQKIDRFIANSDKTPQQIQYDTPLLGVPITVKECCSLAGTSLSVGAKLRSGIRAEVDGQVVTNMKNAGAIPLLVSNIPELCISIETVNDVTGYTNNPYDPTRSAGGSSGGEGALIASGASILGVASDYAGSIRLPCLFNGIYGHKPTPGIISTAGTYPSYNLQEIMDTCVIGPMTRYAEDLELALKVMAGPKADLFAFDKEVNIQDLRFYYVTDFRLWSWKLPINEEINRRIVETVRYFEEAYGCTVKQLRVEDLNIFENGVKSCMSHGIIAIEDTHDLNLKGKNDSTPYVELLKYMCGFSDYTIGTIAFKLLTYSLRFAPEFVKSECGMKRIYLHRTIVDLLGDTAVLIMPSFPETAYRKHRYLLKMPYIVCAMMVNVLGLPATHVPAGLGRNKLPVGFQVIAAPYQDRLCLTVGKELEKFYGGWTPPPSRSS